jgi:hypothetical protein
VLKPHQFRGGNAKPVLPRGEISLFGSSKRPSIFPSTSSLSIFCIPKQKTPANFYLYLFEMKRVPFFPSNNLPTTFIMSQYESHHFGVENARHFPNQDLSAKKSHYLEAQNAPLFSPSTTSLPNSISDRTAGLYMGARHDRRSATQPNTTKTIFPQYCSANRSHQFEGGNARQALVGCLYWVLYCIVL